MSNSLKNFTKQKITFTSGGLKCAADLYLPVATQRALPCVVMGHGFSGTKDFAIPTYAERFVAGGFAVLAFDFRYFGESEGQPRQIIDIKKQREDFHAAIAYARTISQIDPEKIAIWGSSLAGGHVLSVAAEDPRIAAVIAQVPFIDAFKGGVSEKVSARVKFKLLWAAIDDVFRGWLRLKPHYVPVVGEPGSFATMTEPGAKQVVDELVGEGSNWRNEFAPRVAFQMPRYKKGTIEKINAPVLLCVAEKDVQASPEYAINLIQRAKTSEIRRYPVGHFELYVGDMRDKIASDEALFLEKYLAQGI